MIHQIYSTLSSFKTLEFRQGLNILLAEKSPGATEKQTRNGAGKSSLIEVIHFLLGAQVRKNESIFLKSALKSYGFGMTFDLDGIPTTIQRSGKSPSKIFILNGNPDAWPLRPTQVDETSDEWVMSNEHWKRVLGSLIFKISQQPEEEDDTKYGPSFRSLISYFVRQQSNDAFLEPTLQSRWMSTVDQQVAISYLLGLDWTISQQWEYVRRKEKTLGELKRASSGEDEVFGAILGRSAALRTQLFVRQAEVERIRNGLETFQVLPQYHALEREATSLTSQIAELGNENTIDRQLVSDLEAAISSEPEPAFEDLERLYEEVGVILPDSVVKRFEDVRGFHRSVIDNRTSYLEGELSAARQRITERESRMGQLDSRRIEIMSILSTHGALDQYNKLRSDLSRVEGEVESLRQRYEAAEQLEGLGTELELERNRLRLRLLQDFKEQSDMLRQAIDSFEEVSKELYEQAGNLQIDASMNGPVFEIRIQGEKSKGISNMQIFAFDMMLMMICAHRQMGPGFLVHDSHLFDGVDERQVSTALELGAALSSSLGFQYIVTMNSDTVPPNSSRFKLDDYILSTTLTDATETGGLFGFRFD